MKKIRYVLSNYSILITFSFLFALNGNCQSKTDTSNRVSYENTKYNFEIEYPKNYFIKVVSDRYLLIKKKSDDAYNWRISINIKRDKFNEETNIYEKSYSQFTNDLLKSTFCADGPTGSQFGDSVVSTTYFKNNYGADVSENYVNVVYQTYENKKKKIKNTIVGPVFLLELPKQELMSGYRGRAIMLKAIEKEKEEEETVKVLREITASLKFK